MSKTWSFTKCEATSPSGNVWWIGNDFPFFKVQYSIGQLPIWQRYRLWRTLKAIQKQKLLKDLPDAKAELKGKG